MSLALTKPRAFKALFTVLLLSLMALFGCSASTESDENLGEQSESLCTGVKLAGTAAGATLNLTASGATCAGGQTAEYRFAYMREGTTTVVQTRAYGTSPTFAWNTTGLPGGSYQVLVYARAVGTTVAYDSIGYLSPNFLVGNVCNNVTAFTASPNSPQPAGTQVTLTAAATCTGGANAEYRYAYRPPGSANFVFIGGYGPATQNWNTTGLPSGSYLLIVYARAVGNLSTSESSRYGASYQLGSTCSGATISASPAAPQPIGAIITLTATATCSNPEFRFNYRLNGDTTWIQIGGGAYGPSPRAWNTTGLASGVYQLMVEVRQSGNLGGAETTAVSANYALGSACTAVSVVPSPPSPQPIGTVVTLTSSSTCAAGVTPEYRYSYKAPGSSVYTLIRDYGAAAATWNTASLVAGSYLILAEVRTAGRNGVPEANSVIGYVLSPLAITQGSAGLGNHVCARASNGTARCWGANDVGQLGNGATSPSSSTPVVVSGLTAVTSVSSGGSHSCALLADNTVRCWGQNSDGQLGNNTVVSSTTPVVVSGLTDAVAVSAGTIHTCALRSGGGVSCWGNCSYAQCGVNVSGNKQLVPIAAAGVTGASAVVSGGFHSCALVSGGVKCWGDNSLGQLGNGGTPTRSKDAITATGLASGVTSLGSGDSHVCAVVGGAVRCWGDNTYGQLGNGSSSATPVTTPTAVPSLTGVADVAAGFVFSCARLTNSNIRCWGRNVEGELGNGTGVDSFTPVAVSGITTATSLTSGSTMACATLTGGVTRCWGYGGLGALGNGSSANALSPVAVLFP